MKVSIITLTFNSEDTISETLTSILSQDYKNIEHIIIDNESNDQTLEIIESAYGSLSEKRNYKIISEKDRGISDGFNKGILNSTGDIVTCLNSDDSYFDSCIISDIVTKFQESRSDIVHGDMIFIDDTHGTSTRKPLYCSLEEAMPYNHPTMFLKRNIYEEVGLFDLSYRYAMDFHLLCRMSESPKKLKYSEAYLSGRPVVNMKAGGISWSSEIKSIDDVERALKEMKFYTLKARRHLFLRRLRIRLKGLLTKLKMERVVHYWRRLKWK